MSNFKKVCILTLTFCFSFSQVGSACSSFAFGNEQEFYLSKNYDWDNDQAAIYSNLPNLQKTALHSPGDNALKWVSKYASITFNQYGKEFPNGGMNEKGLAMEILWLTGSRSPVEQKPSINELQVIQYMLDTADNIETLIKKFNEIYLKRVFAPVHYIACDKMRKCASIEYINSKLIIHKIDTTYPSLTNSTYSDSIEFLKKHQGFGGNSKIPESKSSLDRFVRMTHYSKLAQNNSSTDFSFAAFEILDRVTDVRTVWQISYDTINSLIYFRTSKNHEIKTIQIKELIANHCRQSSKMQNIQFANTNLSAKDFVNYDAKMNDKLVSYSIESMQRANLKALIPVIQAYPQTVKCIE